jgi:hypothetical protein
MSTRAVYTFKDSHESHSVYKHHDGYPEGAAEWISRAIPLSWGGNRFEAADFGAAFVAANKTGGGSVYLTKNHQAHGDLSYRYEISFKDGAIHVQAYQRSYADVGVAKYKKIFSGSLERFTKTYAAIEA